MAWASPSSGRRLRRLARPLGLLGVAAALAAAAAPLAQAKVFVSRKDAIAQAFPEAERVDEKTHVLTAEQTRTVEALARAKVESKIVKLYTAHGGGAVQGYAFIDIHTVRTQPEAFLVVLTPEGAVRSLRVLAFYEPPEYLPPERWLDQFDGGTLPAGTEPGGVIHGIAGATLSARAVSAGVRRSLALYQVLVAGVKAPPTEAPAEAPGQGPAEAPGEGD